MVEPIGYAPLQIIPVLTDVSSQIDRQLGGLGAVGRRSGAQLGRGLGDGLRSTAADVRRAADAYEKLRNKAEDSLGKVRTAEAQLQSLRARGITDAGRITAAEEKVAAARRNATRASKEAEAAQSALGRSHENLNTRVEGGSRVLGGFAGALDNVSGRLDGVAGRVAGFGSRIATGLAGIETGGSAAAAGIIGVGVAAAGAVVGVSALGAGAVVAGKQLYDLGASYDDLRDSLQIGTGAAGEQLEGLVDVVERLGTTNVAATFGDIGAVVADVTRNLHLTGPALDDVASRLANLATLTGEAVNVRELGKAFRGFGVDAADQAAALDSLFGMSQKTGLSVDDLIGAISKGAPALREFGFGFGESAALVGQLDAAGLNAEKMLAGPLNKALVALRKEGKTGADGLKGIVDQIQALISAGDQLGARGLAEKYFGTKGATDFFDAIKGGSLDLANLSGALAATSTDINQLAKDTGDGAERFTLLRNRIEKALEPLGTTVFDSVNDGLDKLAGWVESHQAQIIDAFVGIGDVVLAVGANSLLGIGQTVEAMGDLAAGLGEAYALSQRIYAAGQDLLGRHDEAKAAREGADAAEDWGENIRNLGRDMQTTAKKSDAWKTSLHALGEEAKIAATATATLNRTVVDGKQVFGPFVGTPFISGAAAAAGGGARGTVTSEEASRLGGGTINTSILTSLRGTNPSAKLTSGMTDHTKDSGEHPKGKAIDVDPSQANLAWAWANRDKLSMIIYDDPNYVWYNMHGERAEGAAARRIYGEDTMKGHGDHIHLAALSEVGGSAASGSIADLGLGTSSAATGAGGQVPDWDAIAQKESGGRWNLPSGDRDSTGGLQIRKGTWDDFGGPALTGQQFPYQATKEQQIAVAEKILAKQGPQAWAGGRNFVWKSAGGGTGGLSALGGSVSSPIDLSRNTLGAVGPGTPGFDDEGKPGFWKADPKAVREADERASDAVNRIADADAAVALALARINELDADASESQKLSAQEALRKAREDTGRARREAQDAQADADEAKKGKFTAEQETKASSSKGFGGLPSLTSFSGIGGALGEFAGGQIGSALETFGIGDSPPWLQAIGGLMGGISIGGSGGDSVSPLSALGTGGAAATLSGAHGGTGAAPGPAGGVTYNIQNGGNNDDLITLLRRREQELGAMLGRF